MNRKESKRRQNVTHVILLLVTVVIYRTHLKFSVYSFLPVYARPLLLCPCDFASARRRLRHRVVAAAAPRIAAQQSPDGEGESLYRAVFYQSLTCIFRARGREAARGWRERRYEPLVEYYREAQKPYDSSPTAVQYGGHGHCEKSFATFSSRFFTQPDTRDES